MNYFTQTISKTIQSINELVIESGFTFSFDFVGSWRWDDTHVNYSRINEENDKMMIKKRKSTLKLIKHSFRH